jgi:phospholipase/lecithinase/hemolysin
MSGAFFMTVNLSLRRAVASASLALMASLAATSAQAYSQLVVFGDSLSDNGNVARTLGGYLPAAPYQFGTFTNGHVAADVMAGALGIAIDDHAYGGALTGLDNQFALKGGITSLAGTGMKGQVSSYIAAAGGNKLDANALYMVWGGGNDFLGALTVGTADAVTTAAKTAIINITTEVATLYAAGARSFFVPTLADFTYTLNGANAPAATQQQLSYMTASFNAGLASALGTLKYSDISIHSFDTNAFLGGVRSDIVANGGSLNTACWTGAYTGAATGGTLCTDPAKHFLFDAVHPSGFVHQALGNAFAASVTPAVPEPSTSGLALVGALGVVWVVRRRQGR